MDQASEPVASVESAGGTGRTPAFSPEAELDIYV